jgi:hypothetical protein
MGILDNIPPVVWPGGPALFGGSGSSSPRKAPTPTPTASKSAKKSAAAAPPAKKKNMTWGGRPDPAPESYVEEKPPLFSKGWRLGKKK